MIISDVLKLKYSNVDFTKDIILQDDGQGVYIKEWNLPDALPTQKDLDAWAIEFDLQYRQNQAVAARQYDTVPNQLDMIYKDLKNNTKYWVASIDVIKADHPKPTE